MARILVTSGPTRQYLDPVRFLTNASSGRMGAALAQAAIDAGHEVLVVSGPVEVAYPDLAEVVPVVTTDELLRVTAEYFSDCQGLIGAAAPCDYRPVQVSEEKIKKTGGPLELKLVETEDVIAKMGREKRSDQWVVGFALETSDARFRGITKLQKKACDMVVINGPEAMDAEVNEVEVIDSEGEVVLQTRGPKREVAVEIFDTIEQRLIKPRAASATSSPHMDTR